MSNRENFEVWAGEDRTLTLHARDSSNAVVDLTNYTVTWMVGRPPNRPYLLWAIINKTATVTDAANGVFTVNVLASDTVDLEGNYFHEAFAVSGSTTIIVSTGRLKVRRSIDQ